MSATPTIERLQRQPTIAIRARTSVDGIPALFDRAFPALHGYLSAKGMQPAGAPYTLYRNDDFADLDLEVGIPVASAVTGEGEIIASEIPAVECAVFLHVGPYDQLQRSYATLKQFIADGGRTPTGHATFEWYLDNPMDTPAEKLRTRLAIELQPA